MNFLYIIIILFSFFCSRELPASENIAESTPPDTLQEQTNTENIPTTISTESSDAEASSFAKATADKTVDDRPADETDKQKEKTIIPPLIPTQPGNESIVPLEQHVPEFSEITVPMSSEKNQESSFSNSKVETKNLEQPQIPTEVEEQTESSLVETLEDMEHDPQVGIDTSSLEEPQGSWLFKRMWWDRAQEAYQKIKNLIDSIMDKRVDFFTKRASLDKELFDVFYLEIGMGLGEFTTLIQELNAELEKERTTTDITEEKQKILDSLTLEKTSIDQVKKHIEILKQIDQAIEQSLSTVIEIINSVRKHEHEAWQYFKEIGEILSDKKARELFYKIDVALQNVKQMSKYLDQQFAEYFENLEIRARSSVEQIRKDLENFKNKGIDLKASIAHLTQEEIKIVEEQRQEEEEIKPKKPVSWWQSIINWPSSIINTIKSYF